MTEFYVLGFDTWGEAHVSGPYATVEEAREELEGFDGTQVGAFIVQRVA